MRIVSNFRDYYDSIQGMGQDLGLQYIRMRKELPLTRGLPSCGAASGHGYRWGTTRIDLGVDDGVVGFCGKIYGFVRLETTDPDAKPDPVYGHRKRLVVYCYNMEAVDAFVEKHFKPKQLAQYRRPVNYKVAARGGATWPRNCARIEFQQFFERVEQSQDHYADVFTEHRCPIWTYQKGGWREKSKLILNPGIKEFEFFRVFDPYTAFQEISMFLGGMASPEKPIPPISDEDLAACKGFDKWSFRTPPGTKKRKKNDPK